MSNKNLNRITGYLRNDEVWLHRCLEDLARRHTQAGIQTTKSDLIRAALLMQYGHLEHLYNGETAKSNSNLCVEGRPVVTGFNNSNSGDEEEIEA